MTRGTFLGSTLGLALTLVGAPDLAAQVDYKRSEVPGHYTVGLYADENGTSREIELEEGEDTFQAWLGLTGDSTQIFSGLVFRLELEYPIEMTGPIRWYPIPGLVHWNNVLEKGVQVEFSETCQEQIGRRPAMLGRLTFRVTEDFDRAEVQVMGHREHRLSVELCDYNVWYKPYADPLHLTVRRKRGFWSKLQRLFG